jgi:hypothetical protein
MENKFCVKIHRSYRTVVAICDSDILGKKFEDEKRQLDLRENFYKEQEVDEKKIRKIMQMQSREDATFNIVGKNSIKISVEEQIFPEEAISNITGIPFALKLI